MNYEMGGTILSKTVKEKDLGVSMNANMKVSILSNAELQRLKPATGRPCVLALGDDGTVPAITCDCFRVAELFMRRRYFGR